jgi:hypothetical protein
LNATVLVKHLALVAMLFISAGDKELMQKRLELYRQNQPFRDAGPSGQTSPAT